MHLRRNAEPIRRTVSRALMLVLAVVLLPMLSMPSAWAQPINPIDPCDAVTPPTYCGVPTGTFASMTRQPAGLVVSGTAKDPDASGPVQVQFKVGASILGNLWTNGTSYSGALPAVGGGVVCATAINQNDGRDKTIGCRTITMGPDPIGYLDETSPGPAGLHVAGWSIDADTASPIDVHVYVDNAFAQAVNATVSRPDVAAAYPGYGSAHGFDLTLPATPGQHTVCAYGINVGAGSVNTQLGCKTVTQGAPPAAPAVVIHRSYTKALLSIYVSDNSTNEDGFKIERAPSTTGPWAQVTYTGPFNNTTAFIWDDNSITPGQSYCYRATAWNSYGSTTSPAVCATALLLPFPTPTNVSATGITQTSVTLSWTDNAVGESWYYINGTGNTIILAGTAGTGAMSRTVTGLTAGTKYCFEIHAMSNGYGWSPAMLCVTTASVPPPAPVGIKTVSMWNCEANSLPGTAWILDHTANQWVNAGAVPTSWTPNGCGSAISKTTADIDLPDKHLVSLFLVIVDGKYCTVYDPTAANCAHWKAGPMLGDANGTDEIAEIS